MDSLDDEKMKTIKELEAEVEFIKKEMIRNAQNLKMKDIRLQTEIYKNNILKKQAQIQALKDVLKLIDEDLGILRFKLLNPNLPELTQANLSGMILSLEELKQKIHGK